MNKFFLTVIFIAVFLSDGCLPGPLTGSTGSGIVITLYGFSIMKEPLDKAIFPAFAAKWKAEHGVDVRFVTSFAGSETVTNQILQGAPADVAILAIERDADRLVQGGATKDDWRSRPNNGIINKTPFIILVRKGNPKQITDFADLAKPDVQLIHPDPTSSGGAQWSILAIYGSELMRSKIETGTEDPARAQTLLASIWKNVFATPDSARAARTTFENGYADVLVTYELEGLMMKQAGEPVDIVVPSATIYSEHPAVLIDRDLTAEKKTVVQAFLKYLWSDEAQQAFVKHHFRSVTNESFNDANPEFAKIEMPFTVQLFGGWEHAYPDVIENVFVKQVKSQQ